MILRKHLKVYSVQYLRNQFTFISYFIRNHSLSFRHASHKTNKIAGLVNSHLLKRNVNSAIIGNLNSCVTGKEGIKQLMMRGKAATTHQEVLLYDFISTREDATIEEWNALINEILAQNFGLINKLNIDTKVIEACINQKKLYLGRNYLFYMKQIGKKLNAATVSYFLKLCYECRLSLLDQDKTRITQFVKHLLEKLVIFDANSGDGLIKGLIILNNIQKALEILKTMEKSCQPYPVTYSVIALALLQRGELKQALEYMSSAIEIKNNVPDEFCETWISIYKKDRQKLDELLLFLHKNNIKLSKLVCEHLLYAYSNLPTNVKLVGNFGVINNEGKCDVCKEYLNRVDLNEIEFDALQDTFLKRVLVGRDIFNNTNPREFENFVNTVEKHAPFTVVIDGLNVGYMAGTEASKDVFSNLVVSTVKYFQQHMGKPFLIGRKHMIAWPHLLTSLQQMNVKYFFIDDISEDDPFIIYSAMYSGIDTFFVTRDLFRGERYHLQSNKELVLFKRWQQSHQIFITYIAPSGRVYTKTPITFQMDIQQTKNNGWHIPYKENNEVSKDDYGIHRKWLCLNKLQ